MKKIIDLKFTKEGFENLRQELQNLTAKRPQVLTRMVAAREQGDLSENAGYHAAKEELARLDYRIRELKMFIKHSEIIKWSQSKTVKPGATVAVETEGQIRQFTIVGNLEADPLKNKISLISPLGAALLGKKVGQMAAVKIPDGQINYKIKTIK